LPKSKKQFYQPTPKVETWKGGGEYFRLIENKIKEGKVAHPVKSKSRLSLGKQALVGRKFPHGAAPQLFYQSWGSLSIQEKRERRTDYETT